MHRDDWFQKRRDDGVFFFSPPSGSYQQRNKQSSILRFVALRADELPEGLLRNDSVRVTESPENSGIDPEATKDHKDSDE